MHIGNTEIFYFIIVQPTLEQEIWIMFEYVSYIYNGRPTESRMWSIEWRHFQWLWTTPNQVFKVMLYFDVEYLINS